MLRPEDAWNIIDDRLEPLESEEVARRSAAGRVLSQSLQATIDTPQCDVSAMDGYALGSALVELPVKGVVAAGDAPGATLGKHEAVRIMTGAPIPEGTERVVPIELTDGGKESVSIQDLGNPGQHIRRQGEVVRRGDALFGPGHVLTPGAMGLLATHGAERVDVYRRPSVAVLTTGDEVVPPEAEPGPGQLRDSHTDFFLAALSELGIEGRSLGIAPDRVEDLFALVEEGARSDVLILSGGVSMGEFDFVESVLGRLGCEVLFDAVAIQPGKPVVAARHPGGWIFGLPGNPASAAVTYWLFVRPTLRRLQGFDDGYWREAIDAELAGPLPRAKGRDRFFSCSVHFDNGRPLATPHLPHGSHDVVAYGRGSGIVRVPAGADAAEPGAPCSVLPIANWVESPLP